jgi:hypothetical protein
MRYKSPSLPLARLSPNRIDFYWCVFWMLPVGAIALLML